MTRGARCGPAVEFSGITVNTTVGNGCRSTGGALRRTSYRRRAGPAEPMRRFAPSRLATRRSCRYDELVSER